MPKFNPNWDIWFLVHRDDYQYCVIKKPEPIPGEKELMVREGCTVLSDGRWFYWSFRKPQDYEEWKTNGRWTDKYMNTPDTVVSTRLNQGNPGVIKAPVFKANEDNNWQGYHNHPTKVLVIPERITDEDLGDLMLAHLQLCEELQEGKPMPKKA